MYFFWGPKDTFLMVILEYLDENQKEPLLLTLQKYQGVLAYNMVDVKVVDLLHTSYFFGRWSQTNKANTIKT